MLNCAPCFLTQYAVRSRTRTFMYVDQEVGQHVDPGSQGSSSIVGEVSYKPESVVMSTREFIYRSMDRSVDGFFYYFTVRKTRFSASCQTASLCSVQDDIPRCCSDLLSDVRPWYPMVVNDSFSG